MFIYLKRTITLCLEAFYNTMNIVIPNEVPNWSSARQNTICHQRWTDRRVTLSIRTVAILQREPASTEESD